MDWAGRVAAGWQQADNDAHGQAKRAFLDFMVANCGNTFVYRMWREHGLWPYAHRSPQVAEQVWAKLDRDRGDYALSLAEAIAAGDQDEADRIAQQGIRQIAEILRSILMGSQADVSTLLAGAGVTTDQRTDSSSPS